MQVSDESRGTTFDRDAYLAEYKSDKPIPVGSVVEYHGSLDYAHGAYVVIESEHYKGVPGSVTIQDVNKFDNPPTKFGDFTGILYNVRPKSVTVVVLPSEEN